MKFLPFQNSKMRFDQISIRQYVINNFPREKKIKITKEFILPVASLGQFDKCPSFSGLQKSTIMIAPTTLYNYLP